jgi:hypothetical protein
MIKARIYRYCNTLSSRPTDDYNAFEDMAPRMLASFPYLIKPHMPGFRTGLYVVKGKPGILMRRSETMAYVLDIPIRDVLLLYSPNITNVDFHVKLLRMYARTAHAVHY